MIKSLEQPILQPKIALYQLLEVLMMELFRAHIYPVLTRLYVLLV